MSELMTTGQDWANHIARILDSNSYIHIIARFDGRLDAGILKKTVETTIRIQPVLGCRFDESVEPPVWNPFDGGKDRAWFTDILSTDAEQAIKDFIENIQLPDGQLLLVRLIRDAGRAGREGADGDALCIKLDHACCDGGGAKAYLGLLRSVYNMLYEASGSLPEGNSLREPQPNADRSARQVFAARGLSDMRNAYRPEKYSPVRSAAFPFLKETSSVMRYETLAISLAALRPISDGGPAGRITVSDRIIAAFLRTLAKYDEESLSPGSPRTGRQAVNLTVDLRRYLDQNNLPAVCNLSGMEKVRIECDPGENYDETLGKVHDETLKIKKDSPGLHSAASMEFLTRMGYAKAKDYLLQASSKAKLDGNSTPILSNLGFIYKDKLTFGETEAAEVYAVTPAMHAPSFMLGVSSYNGIMKLAASYFEKEHTAGQIRGFLLDIKKELCGAIQHL